METGMMSYL